MTEKKMKTNPDEPVSEMFMCMCNGESVMISRYKNEPEIYMSFWAQGFTPKSLSWWMRVKLCYQVLTGGMPYIDEVIISRATAMKMVAHFNKICKL